MDTNGWHRAFHLNPWCGTFFSASKKMSEHRVGIGIPSILNIPPWGVLVGHVGSSVLASVPGTISDTHSFFHGRDVSTQNSL